METRDTVNSGNAADEVKTLFLASAPERSNELEEIWERFAPQIYVIEDHPGFHMSGGPFGLICFTNRTMLQLWILGFAAQRSFIEYSGLFVFSQLFVGKYDPSAIREITSADKYVPLIKAVEELFYIENISDFSWPAGVPHPANGKPSDLYGSMVFDLLCMAAAYLFLHELQHVKCQPEESIDSGCYEVELSCDEFARKFLLEQIETYSNQSGYPLNWLITKRAMSIGLALFWLLVITPKKIWRGSRSHPPILSRIIALTEYLQIPENDHFWNYFACLVLSQLLYKSIITEEFTFQTQKELCLKLLAYLNCD